MMDLTSTQRLAPGCRLHPTRDVLLVPEGTMNLTGPAREILTRLDGQRNVTAIVADLLREYEDAEANEVQGDLLRLLERMEERGIVQV
jgi:coenzyme PQQ biosynthesis protein PqqD